VNYDASLMGLADYLRIGPSEWFEAQQAEPAPDISRDVVEVTRMESLTRGVGS